MSEIEKWGLIAVLVVLSALVGILIGIVRELRRDIESSDNMIKMTDRMLTDRYWKHSHEIALIFDYLGVYIDVPQTAQKLVKKGSPERVE